MAQDQNKTPPGGQQAEAAATRSGADAGQSAKDRSRAQSRPVSGKAPTGKAGQATGGRQGAAAPKGGEHAPARRQPGRPATPSAAALGGHDGLGGGRTGHRDRGRAGHRQGDRPSSSTDNSFTPVTPAPASVVHDVTNIPASVYNTVGVDLPDACRCRRPTILSNQPPMTLDGKSPAMLYYGAEYCPYCAAERWAMTAALSRFGTWSNLKITASSHTDVDAGDPHLQLPRGHASPARTSPSRGRAVHQRADVGSRRLHHPGEPDQARSRPSSPSTAARSTSPTPPGRRDLLPVRQHQQRGPDLRGQLQPAASWPARPGARSPAA